MHSNRDVIIPVVTDGSFSTELALNSLRSYQRITTDNTRLPGAFAVKTSQTTFINIVTTELTVSHG
jgi:hypothetical protein